MEMNATDDLPIIPIGMKDAPFALDMWARDCPPTQFLREFTVNGLEAIEAYRREADATFKGEVTWTIDPVLDAAGQQKLCCIDSGIGMSASEMPDYLNDLASSGKTRGLNRNYGIGAKVSAAVGNPRGVIYASWQHGSGHIMDTGRDSEGVWGLRQHRRRDGTVTAVIPVDDAVKPDELRGLDHGTVVTFLGASDDDDTTQRPSGETSDRWIAKTLNQRFYELPSWATVRVREIRVAGDERAVRFRTVRGQKYFLDQHTEAHGRVKVAGATVHWRILTDNHVERTKQADVWASTGHRACLFQGEIFELATSSRGGYQKLMEFGVRFGYERVVLYVEPDAANGTVTQDTVRSQVKVDGQALPWERYAAEFEEQMPGELRAFQERIAAGSRGQDHSDAIRDRLRDVADLYKISRYRPARPGSTFMDDPNTGGRSGDERGHKKRAPSPPRESGGSGGSVYALFERDGGTNAERVDAEALPEIDVTWVSERDGTRTPPHLEDRAARYDRRRNHLEINADFRGFRDIVGRWEKRYRAVAGAAVIVEDMSGGWWQQALTETVLGVLALRGSQYWNDRTVDEALSEAALTAAAMQRYHLDAVLKRDLANRLGALRHAA
jgi:hypothetical protein